MDQNLLNARRIVARAAYKTYDFLDASVEGQFDWEVKGDELHRTVFLAPIEAEDGVEMVTFCVSFQGPESAEPAKVRCVTSAGNHYGQPGKPNAGYMRQSASPAQATTLYS